MSKFASGAHKTRIHQESLDLVPVIRELIAQERGRVPAEIPAKAPKRSTSLYLAPAALKAMKGLAADKEVRPHRVIDEALAAYFARHGLDFDTLNGG